MIFLAEYRCTDGGYTGEIVALDWQDAVDRATELGCRILGLLDCEVDPETGAVTERQDPGALPTCPPFLRNHPAIKRRQ